MFTAESVEKIALLTIGGHLVNRTCCFVPKSCIVILVYYYVTIILLMSFIHLFNCYNVQCPCSLDIVPP